MKAPLKGQVQREGGSPWWSLDSGVTPSAVTVGNAEGGRQSFCLNGTRLSPLPSWGPRLHRGLKTWTRRTPLSLNCLGKREEKRTFLFRAPTVCQALSHKCFPRESSRTSQQLWGYYLHEGESVWHGLRMLTQPTGWLFRSWMALSSTFCESGQIP